MQNRIAYDEGGALDEVVTDGGAHLERMDDGQWFLSCVRADGSEFAVWIDGRVTMTEERDASSSRPGVRAEVEGAHLPPPRPGADRARRCASQEPQTWHPGPR